MSMWLNNTAPKTPHPSRWPHAKALWALGWRMLALSPIVGIFGSLALVAVLALNLMPPALAVIWVISTDYLWAVVTLVLWLVWLRFGSPVRRFVFEGFEHGSI